MSGWNPAAGPALFVPGRTRDEAVVLMPYDGDLVDENRLDSLGERHASILLLGRGRASFVARLDGVPDNESYQHCDRWPLNELQSPGAEWAVGFVQGDAVPLPLDSVQLLSPRDSLALAAEASRLASTVTLPTDSSFQGLRFTAHDIRRFDAAPGVQALVAHLLRHVNQEANPREEQTLLVAERDSGAMTGPYRLAYAERTSGREEEVTTPEIVAGARIGRGIGRPTLIVARDDERGVAYSFLERTGARRWRTRWTSDRVNCDGAP